MMLRTGLAALALITAAPMAAQAQTIDLGRGGPTIDLRSERQRQRDFTREQIAREEMRRDRRDAYRMRERDRDFSTGSIRRGDRFDGYEDRGRRYDRY